MTGELLEGSHADALRWELSRPTAGTSCVRQARPDEKAGVRLPEHACECAGSA